MHVSIQSLSLRAKQTQEALKHFFPKLEERYKNEYQERYLPYLEEGSIKSLFGIFKEGKLIGISVLRQAQGETFGASGEVLKITLFRILPSYRGQGIGRWAFETINNRVFEEYQVNTIYAGSRELGALKLYAAFPNVSFIDADGVIPNPNFLMMDEPHEFLLPEDVNFMVHQKT